MKNDPRTTDAGIIDAFIPCAPYHPLSREGRGRRGLHQLINPVDGFEAVRFFYADRFAAMCGEAGVELRVHYHNPWGREAEPVPVEGQDGERTTMRADSKAIADGDPEWWWLSGKLTEAIVRGGMASTVYTGANPAGMTIASAGFVPMLNLGIDMAFDAAASQVGTPMLASIARHNSGRPGRAGLALVEANADRLNLPCIARWHLWGRPGRHPLDAAPPGSRVLLNNGLNSPDEWGVLTAAATAGVRPVVNLAETDDVGRLVRLVAAGGREGAAA